MDAAHSQLKALTSYVDSRKSARLRRHAYRRWKALTRGFSSPQRKRTHPG